MDDERLVAEERRERGRRLDVDDATIEAHVLLLRARLADGSADELLHVSFDARVVVRMEKIA